MRFLKKMLIPVVVLIIGFWLWGLKVPTEEYDLVIYGGGFAGCAAAYNAAQVVPYGNILLVVPDPVSKLGGLGTIGGQNFADIRYWQNELVTQGSFQRWFEECGQFYNPLLWADILKAELSQFTNLTILYQHDLQKVSTEQLENSQQITSLLLRPIARTSKGEVHWKWGKLRVLGKVFIDASDEGRLTRLAGEPFVVGRQDWPWEYLPEDEKEMARQQAATLMFQVKGVRVPSVAQQIEDLHFVCDQKGSWGIVGGREIWQKNPIIRGFNELHGPEGWAIKPLNAAQCGANSDTWWVNMLLIFDVDGTDYAKDRSFFASRKKTVDDFWIKAHRVLAEEHFLKALREFKVIVDGKMYGLGEVNIVKDEAGQPLVGEVIYLRETVHLKGKGALTTEAVQQAGSSFREGKDRDYYSQRIGLGYYLMDINAYQYCDLKQGEQFVWPVTEYLRPDWQLSGGQPVNPVYLPFQMLVPVKNVNLLVPGYAVGCSSMAWSSIRVLPNLAVLGDAAGVAAARALLFNEDFTSFDTEQITWVQKKLKELGARLDK